MRYLLDTNIFIWWMEKSKKLPHDLYTLINDPKNKVFLSVVSIWEIVIKRGKDRFKVPKDIEIDIKTNRFNLLPIHIEHALEVGKLPFHHKDPFDRILISQAKIENLILISSDKKIWKYNLPLLKA